MWPYLITYELIYPERYSAVLADILADLGAVRLVKNAWLLTSDWNASAILEQLRPILSKDDRLLVVELGEDLAGLNLNQPVWDGQTAVFQKCSSSKVN